jgi:demethylmenaquinone methyltransferase / 2-methoxy-6-polyprenyl-1,4-benzoquinol methylase
MASAPTPSESSRAALRPHDDLPAYYEASSAHRAFVQDIFDSTAVDYNRIEGLLAWGSGPSYRRDALRRAGLAAGDRVLDVGIGTGLVAREALGLIGAQGSLVGVDPSPGMMAQIKLPGVTLVEGFAEQLPRPDSSADFLSMGYALRHVSDVRPAMAEFHRTLRPGGRLLILEITRPTSRLGRWALKTYMRLLVPALARWVTRSRHTPQLWRYYWDTIEACIPPEQVCAELRAAGFTNVQRHVELGIFSEYTATRPALA